MMKELKPMLEEGASEATLRLLRTAHLDGPVDPEVKQARMLAAVLAVRPVTPPPSRYGWWFAGGLGTSVLVLGLWSALSAPGATQAPTRTVQRAHVARIATSPEWSALPAQIPPVESLPMAAVAPHREPPPTSVAASDPLVRIDRARQHLASAEPQLALDEVQRYRSEFPGGAYRDEADALEVQALLRLGQRDRATTLGRAFLRERPASPQAERVARLLGEAP